LSHIVYAIVSFRSADMRSAAIEMLKLVAVGDVRTD